MGLKYAAENMLNDKESKMACTSHIHLELDDLFRSDISELSSSNNVEVEALSAMKTSWYFSSSL
jgi:hypothetical protein